ncbi:MAG: helix-turn-helix transcriptional regulator [Desulfomicrobium sp.]|nr:helix-turn-helix transcriptional regulator [Desulfomicrobium sp.]
MNTIFDITDLGSRIAILRREQGLSQAELAGQAGVSRAMISDLETGRLRDPGTRKVLMVLKALGMGIRIARLSPPTLDELLAEQEDFHA